MNELNGLTVEQKNELIKQARERVAAHVPEMVIGRCLHNSLALQKVIQEQLGVKTFLVAGSLHWQCINPELDDGKMPTHFSFQFSPNSPQSLIAMLGGDLPEMHCWLMRSTPDPVQHTLIDPTTNELVAQAQRLGIEWTAKTPPDYVWGTLPLTISDATYVIEEYAMRLVRRFSERLRY